MNIINKKYKFVEQIKDSYGNLVNCYGVYEKTATLEKFKLKRIVKLIKTFDSLKEARDYLS
ncbi:MAG: hypothetical protein EBR82_66680 [Caulobacteraceae bacterium]|nr:hypothetical protein [Caulobacteraceae bacterium]